MRILKVFGLGLSGLALGWACSSQTANMPEEVVSYEEQTVQPVREQAEPVREEPMAPPPAPVPPERLAPVYFAYDKFQLTPEARAMLSMHAKKLETFPDVDIRIEGHCDERGTIEYNLALGDKRATIVKEYLVNYGIDPARITTISYGKERPADSGHNEAAWARNRRARFVIIK